MCVIGVCHGYNGYLAPSRAASSARAGVHGRQARPTHGEVRSLCGSGRGTGIRGTAKALEGFGALALALVLVLLPRVAFASFASDQYGEPVYGPVEYDWQGEHYTNVAYIAANKYDAAAYACGYSKSEIGEWDLTVRAKLSNESTAPEFYELANGFYAPVPDDFVYTDYGPAPGFWGWAYSIYGEGNIWYHDGYTDTQVNAAKSEVESILNGGGSGGGSGEPELGKTDYVLARAPGDKQLTAYGYGYNNGSGIRRLAVKDSPDNANWSLGSSTVSWIDGKLSSGYDVFLTVMGTDDPSRLGGIDQCIYAVPHGSCEVQTISDIVTLVSVSDTRFTPLLIKMNASSCKYEDGELSFVFTSHWNSSADSVAKGGVVHRVNGSTSQHRGGYYLLVGSDGSSSNPQPDPEPPSNNWPETDEPSTPTPPDPYAPTGGGDYVAPTLPKPTSPTQPVNVSVTVSTPVDDILDALNKIIQELENHCVHLQNKMVECSRYLGALQEQTRDAVIDAINEGMQNDVTLHDELMDYLRELLQWMKDNMKYDVEVTNTNNNDDVIDWLKRIYIQDGTGYSNTKPIDITQDYNGFGVWVDGVIDNLLPDLTDTNLAPVTSAFDHLDDKFPFSVPSDVLRIFQSLDRSPVTPVVTFTIPAMLGISSYTYSFDLSSYNGTMETIRTIELMAFVVFLLVWARRAFNAEAGGASD